MQDATSQPIRFCGFARDLETIVAVADCSPHLVVAATLDAGLTGAAVEAPTASARILAPGIVRLRLRFPREAAAGRYSGELSLGEERRRFVADVKPQAYLFSSPISLKLSGGAGEQASAEIILVNSGNGDVDIPEATAFGLFREGGLDTALGKAYRAVDVEGRPWIDRLGDNLTEEHGGLVHVRIVRGAGRLRPGEMRAILCHLRLPDRLQTAKLYTGALQFGELAVPVAIAATAGNARETIG